MHGLYIPIYFCSPQGVFSLQWESEVNIQISISPPTQIAVTQVIFLMSLLQMTT